jgi:hypothetical protein
MNIKIQGIYWRTWEGFWKGLAGEYGGYGVQITGFTIPLHFKYNFKTMEDHSSVLIIVH